jgi:peptide/nickel transport system substrate-binding protein
MDFDMRTIQPGLAARWDVSPDGLTYTFHLREDVTFCDGKPFTAADMAFSLNRWIGRTTPRIVSPVAWRAGNVKEIRATGPHTLVYELNEPFGELLSQLTLFFGSALDPAAVERLGDNFGVQGFNGTGPYCWGSWTPRNEMVLTRHPNYRWGPPSLDHRLARDPRGRGARRRPASQSGGCDELHPRSLLGRGPPRAHGHHLPAAQLLLGLLHGLQGG